MVSLRRVGSGGKGHKYHHAWSSKHHKDSNHALGKNSQKRHLDDESMMLTPKYSPRGKICSQSYKRSEEEVSDHIV